MEVKKEKISWIEKVADKILQISTDTDVIVPDVKPDIKKILQVDAHARMTSHELQSDRVLVCGSVDFNVIYMPDDDSMKPQSIKTQAPFTDVLPFKGVTPGMVGDFEAEISSVNYRIINGRKFSVKSTVEIVSQIKKSATVECVSEIENKSIQLKSRGIEYLSKSAECEKNFAINEKVVIPQSEISASEVLKVSPKITDYNVKVISNKVILKGEVQLVCAYTDADEGNVVSINHVVPFTEILDVDGIKADDLCNARMTVSECNYNCEEDVNGEIRSIETKTDLKIKLSALRDGRAEMLDDCYATENKLKIERKKANIPVKIADVDYQDTFKTKIELKNDDPKISRVYDAFSKAYVDKIERINDKLAVSGTIDNYVLYVTDQKDTPIYCVKNEIDFSESFDCEGKPNATGDFHVRALNTSYTLNDDNTVELRINVKMDGVMYSTLEVGLITDITVEELAVRPNVASLTVYFVQENDTLWDIAKKYLTTTDAILNINDISDNELKSGMQLLIPKYKV